MVTVNLSPTLEKRLWTIVQDDYNGDMQAAMAAFLALHEKYSWKEQLRSDVEAVRNTVRRQGGIKESTIEDAIARHRKRVSAAHV